MSAEAAAVDVPEAPVAATAPNMYKLVSKDEQVFTISAEAAEQSNLLSTTIARCAPENRASMAPIPVNNVTGNILEMVIKWCEQHKGEALPVDDGSIPKIIEVPQWDADFLKISSDVLFDLIVACNELDVPGLMNFGCKKVADMAAGKSPEDMRIIYGIPTDKQDADAAEKAAKEEAERNAPAQRDESWTICLLISMYYSINCF